MLTYNMYFFAHLFQAHVDSIHKKVAELHCADCERIFSSKYALTRQVVTRIMLLVLLSKFLTEYAHCSVNFCQGKFSLGIFFWAHFFMEHFVSEHFVRNILSGNIL